MTLYLRRAVFFVIVAVTPGGAQTLDATERRIVQHVDQHADEAVILLERIVNINSGTLNSAGQQRVAEILMPEFRELGFEVRYAPLPDSLKRGGHLIAERRGKRGKKLLLIGHLDTVFEEDSPFQLFERIDANTAAGPGILDMKSGDVVIVHALKALHSAGILDHATLTVVLTGDEERPGRPLSVARHELIEAGKRSDVALGFEAGVRDEQGDFGTIGRRSSSSWTLRVKGTPAHSSGVFGNTAGAGAIFEAARILSAFYNELRGEEHLTFNPGMIVGGTEAELRKDATGSASGKTNIVAEHAIVQGDLRTLTNEQLERTRQRMRAIVEQNLPRTSAAIEFEDGYPSMAPTPGNLKLLELYDEVSRALGFSPVQALDPGRRGAADISFVAEYVDALDGLGASGSGSHTVAERLDLRSMSKATKRAAILMRRLLMRND
jgi:glutamate carboxypeptidase